MITHSNGDLNQRDQIYTARLKVMICINVCPTGIDIRNGTQLECLNCTLCMDACDDMMDHVVLEKGLIRCDSEEGIRTGNKWKLTGRAKAYIVLMFAIVGLLMVMNFSRSEIKLNLLSLKGTSYTKLNDTTIVNIYQAKITTPFNAPFIIDCKIEVFAQ